MAQVTEVTVPDIGDFSDVPIIEIMVSEGDSVAPEDPLVTLESDKATMDVPSPSGGVVTQLKVSVGDTVSEGSPILSLTLDGDEAASAEAEAPGAVESAVEAEQEAGTEPAPAAAAAPEPAEAPERDGGPPYASPSVRRLARERGIDLSNVQGSGRKGRITKE